MHHLKTVLSLTEINIFTPKHNKMVRHINGLKQHNVVDNFEMTNNYTYNFIPANKNIYHLTVHLYGGLVKWLTRNFH